MISSNTKKYFSSNIINKISNLSLRAKLVVEGFIIGLHKSPYHGFSAEFSDHRLYQKGDSQEKGIEHYDDDIKVTLAKQFGEFTRYTNKNH